jgi:ribulose kinase
LDDAIGPWKADSTLSRLKQAKELAAANMTPEAAAARMTPEEAKRLSMVRNIGIAVRDVDSECGRAGVLGQRD